MNKDKWDLQVREDVDRIYDRIVSNMNLTRNKDKVILLVEGYYDLQFYKHFIDNKNVVIFFTNGCERMNALVEIVDKKGYDFIAIQDSDFGNLGFPNSGMVKMYFTDYHDYEMTCLASKSVWARMSKELELDKNTIDQVEIMNDIETLSFYRFCSRKNDFYNGFKNIDKIVREQKNIDYNNIHSSINNNHPLFHDIQLGFFKVFVIDNKQVTSDPFNFHNGHDFLNRIVYKINLNEDNEYYGCKEKDVQEVLVDSTTLSDFHQTQLYKDIQGSESTKKRIFK